VACIPLDEGTATAYAAHHDEGSNRLFQGIRCHRDQRRHSRAREDRSVGLNSAHSIVTLDDWVARADSIPEYLDKAIGDKVNRYGAARNACWLVVYLNIDEWGIRQTQIEQVIADTIFRYRDRFENLSVLWKGKLYGASEMP
jgi:hypothetical protein